MATVPWSGGRPDITDDDRYIVSFSGGTIKVHDAASGQLVSSLLASDGSAPQGTVRPGDIAENGTRFAFTSSASNLVSGDPTGYPATGREDVFIADALTGRAIARVDALDDYLFASAGNVIISGDGQLVAFSFGSATPGASSGWGTANAATGGTIHLTTFPDNPGGPGPDADPFYAPTAISDNGSRIALGSTFSPSKGPIVKVVTAGGATIWSADQIGGDQVVQITDLAGASNRAVVNVYNGTSGPLGLIVVDGGGIKLSEIVGLGGATPNADIGSASISADGRFVAFDSTASNLVAGDSPGTRDVFIADAATGQVLKKIGLGFSPDISGDGSRVVYAQGGNLVTAETGLGTPNQPPVANADAVTLTGATGLDVIDVLANDSDPDGTLDPASLRIERQPSTGRVSAAGGVVSFAYPTSFAGEVTFTYTIADTLGARSAPAIATVKVNRSLFTEQADTVDLNSRNLSDFTQVQAGNALGGDDVVRLSDKQNIRVPFSGGDGNDTITGSSKNDIIAGGTGNDTFVGSKGSDDLSGEAGADVLTVKGPLSAYNVALRDGPLGSEGTYAIAGVGKKSDLGQTVTHGVEQVLYAGGITNIVDYPPDHLQMAGAWSLLAFNETTAVTERAGWRPLEAIDLGMPARGLFLAGGNSYTFDGGVFRSTASDSAVAHVHAGVYDGERTLMVAFRGVEIDVEGLRALAAFHANDELYRQFEPLEEALGGFIDRYDVERVILTGHSVGGSMAMTMAAEAAWVGSVDVDVVAFGAPGLDSSASDARGDTLNFRHVDDILAMTGQELARFGRDAVIALVGLKFGRSSEVLDLAARIYDDVVPRAVVGSEVVVERTDRFALTDGVDQHLLAAYRATLDVLDQAGLLTEADLERHAALGGSYTFGTDGRDLLGVTGYDQDSLEPVPTVRSSGPEIMLGFDDRDVLEGLGGRDTLLGGAGNDELHGGVDTDKLTGGADADLFSGTLAEMRFDWITDLTSADAIEIQGEAITLAQLRYRDGFLEIETDATTLGPEASIRLDLPGTPTFTVAVEDLFGSPPSSTIRLAAPSLREITGTSGNNTLTGTAAAERILGLGGNDKLKGNGGDDSLVGGTGSDALTGGVGRDTGVFAGPSSEFSITKKGQAWTVKDLVAGNGNEGTDTLQTTELLRFDDGLFDITGTRPSPATLAADALRADTDYLF